MNITWQYKQNHFTGDGENDARIYTARHNHKLRCVVSGPGIGKNTPEAQWHLSISLPERGPNQEEIDSAIAEFIPEDIQMDAFKHGVIRTINSARRPALHFHQHTGEDKSYALPYVRPQDRT